MHANALPPCHDETRAADGSLRPHWRALLASLAQASESQWREWQDSAQQRIRENGITYNVYADPKGADRPWPLDIVPLVLPADEWRGIAAAIGQRARLLDRVLADLYGPQELLADKAVPPALVYGHNGFLWPCRGIAPPGGRFLHLYAADIARGPDGRWWVLADRTQAPSGAGYALENRAIVSRLFADACRDLQVQQPGEWYRALQEVLAAHAPVDDGEMPFVVLLTPGPHNETYFEHVFLARHLGFVLAEGQDLTVRGDSVFLKTLGGLKRVHAILRRLDDDFCDPLDLRADSTLGVAGLVEVARAGRVLIANALGSGVLESPALTGFLPGLCERLLGEPLAMPSVAAWWCGEAAALEYVARNIDALVIKPAYPSQRMEPVFGNRLDATERAQWIERIRARPNAYVAQEIMQLSQAPVLVRDLATGDTSQLVSRAVGLRVYAVATADGRWQVLPGGLARVAGDTNHDILSMQRGGSSKDVWVLSDASSQPAVALPETIGLRDIVRAPVSLPSRAAENLFWLGRYLERAESHARLLRLALTRLVESDARESGAPVLALCVQAGLLPAHANAAARSDRGLPAAVFDGQWPGGLLDTVRRAGLAAGQVRERLSADHWQALEQLQDIARRAAAARTRPRLDAALALTDRVLSACARLTGHAMDDMVRDAGWRFMVSGRRIERLQCVSALVAGLLEQHADAPDAAVLLLGATDCVDTWRYRYPRPPELLPALDIVVFDEGNPRALMFQAGKLLGTLAKLRQQIDGVPDGGLASATEALQVGGLDAAFADPRAGLPLLARQLRQLWQATATLSNQLADRHFTHVADATSRSLAV